MSFRNHYKYKETQYKNRKGFSIQNGRRSKRRQTRTALDPFVIPVVKNAPVQTRVIRYVMGSGDSASVQTLQFRSKDLLSLMGMATSATSFTSIIESVHLTGVRIFAVLQPSSTAEQATLSYTWKGEYTREEEYSFTVSQMTPVNAFMEPPENSNAQWWYSVDTTTLDLFMMEWQGTDMQITVDLHFSYILPHGQDNTLETLTSTGLTTGKFYYPEVPAVGTTIQLTPVGLDTF